jgi:hypothetical protein
MQHQAGLAANTSQPYVCGAEAYLRARGDAVHASLLQGTDMCVALMH